MDKLMQDPAELKKFLRKVMGPERRVLTGEEYNHILLIMNLTEPVRSSNNQRTMTDEYRIEGKRYDATYGLEDTPEIAEIAEDDTTESD
jgi:hypothetical protein